MTDEDTLAYYTQRAAAEHEMATNAHTPAAASAHAAMAAAYERRVADASQAADSAARN